MYLSVIRSAIGSTEQLYSVIHSFTLRSQLIVIHRDYHNYLSIFIVRTTKTTRVSQLYAHTNIVLYDTGFHHTCDRSICSKE